MESPLKGKRCVGFVRFARAETVGPVCETRQYREIVEFAKEQELELVGVEASLGTSGSSTPIELESLAERAIFAKDFDVMLIRDLTRLSRDSIRRFALQFAFKCAGVTVISIADWPDVGLQFHRR